MSVLHPLKYGLRIANTLRARPGQLVYCRGQISITACFYELVKNQGIEIPDAELDYLALLRAPSKRLGRPCIILDRLPDSHFTVCFISQIRGRNFSPIGRFFGVPIENRKSLSVSSSLVAQQTHKSEISFPPLQLTPREPTGGQFYLFAIPVARQGIHLPPGGPVYLVDEDLQRTVEFVRQRIATCRQIHSTLRRDQLDWVEANPLWRFKNPQEEGVGYLRL
ncbi:hypothetical protein C8R45DRAFT_68897 [Mycena sanguinolenta]|nr:hypothetical protein C8R45DRAFT_68897 [Mycena sanguinolenta]